MQKNAMTAEGESALRKELNNLIKVVRPSIVEAISTAREHGDLKENAEYHAAREQQSFAEGRIQDIEGKLSNAQVIDISKIPQGDRVIFGSVVTIIKMDTDETVTYRIVGDDEADIKVNKISVYSPVARSLIGKQQDDVVLIQIPSGQIEYEILSVEHL